MNMGVDFRKNVVPTLPDIIICPLCKEKHEKKNLIYATNMLRSRFRSKYKDGIRVRSYKTPTVFYFCCNNCSLHFTFKNQKSENMIRGKEGNY